MVVQSVNFQDVTFICIYSERELNQQATVDANLCLGDWDWGLRCVYVMLLRLSSSKYYLCAG